MVLRDTGGNGVTLGVQPRLGNCFDSGLGLGSKIWTERIEYGGLNRSHGKAKHSFGQSSRHRKLVGGGLIHVECRRDEVNRPILKYLCENVRLDLLHRQGAQIGSTVKSNKVSLGTPWPLLTTTRLCGSSR